MNHNPLAFPTTPPRPRTTSISTTARARRSTWTVLFALALIAFSVSNAQASGLSVGAPTVIPPTGGSNLSLDPFGAPNLDWARWLTVPPASYNHKNGAPPPALISTYAPIGSSGTTLLTNPFTPFVIPAFKWNPGDGTPIASVSPPLLRRALVRGGPGPSVGSGFVFKAAASNVNTRLLTAFVGARDAKAELIVTLSDPPFASPPTVIIPLFSIGYTTWSIPIKYVASGTSAQLKIGWRETSCGNPNTCSVNLQAATLFQ